MRRSIFSPISKAPFLLLALLMGCHVNSTRINNAEDKAAAEAFTDAYLMHQKQGKDTAVIRSFSQQLWKTTSRAKMNQLFRKRNEVLGRLQHLVLDQWHTEVVTGTDSSSVYTLQYKNQYEKGEAVETFTLRREAHDSLKIVGYNINSDAFMR